MTVPPYNDSHPIAEAIREASEPTRTLWFWLRESPGYEDVLWEAIDDIETAGRRHPGEPGEMSAVQTLRERIDQTIRMARAREPLAARLASDAACQIDWRLIGRGILADLEASAPAER